MNAFQNFLANTWFGGIVKNFVSVVLGAYLVDLVAHNAIDLTEAKSYLVAGVVAVLPVIINALNPADTRYGLNKPGA